MARVLRLLVTPRWLLRHLLVVALCVAFSFLSRWQFHRGEAASGTVQNYGYAVEWLAFGGCVCFAWWRLLLDELHPERIGARRRTNPWRGPASAASPGSTASPGPAGAAGSADRPGPAIRRAVGPVTTPEIDPDDLEVVRYNAYLAEYATRGRR